MSCFPANSCPPKKKFARKKGHSTKERTTCQSVSFFLLFYALEDNDPAPTLPLGVTARLFSARFHLHWYRFTANLFFYLTQSNHKSALLFSCTCPFSGACAYYITFLQKSQTYVRVFLRKTEKIFQVIHNPKEKDGTENEKIPQLCNENPPAAMKKGRPPAGQRGRLFAAGFSVAAFFLVTSVLKQAV